ncbi:MAG: CapA family protein [Eubacteriales bacterium]|nr:CapA family protein [Eubacteriales bacterium]
MKNFIKGMGIGICIGIPLLLAVLFGLKAAGVFPSLPQNDAAQAETDGKTPEDGADADGDADPDAAATDGSADPDGSGSDDGASDPDGSDAEISKDPEAAAQADPDTILAFAGDVMFSEQYLAAYDQSGVSALADAEMLSRMQEADLFLLNEEFPFSLRGEPMADKQFTFRTDPKYVRIFQELGADIVTVANNHSLDFGRDAFCDTLDALDSAGIARAGGGFDLAEASSPVVRTVNGQTFAVFGATRVSPSYDWYATDSQAGIFQTYDPARLNAAIGEARKTSDHVIVFVHWGIERNETPEEYQRTLAQGYIDAGADLVVGCHPHVLQGFEYYKGAPIIYSLGNYLFGNRTGDTLLLEADYTDGGAPAIRLVPCRRVDGVLSRIGDPSALYEKLTQLSYGVTVNEDGTLSAQ